MSSYHASVLLTTCLFCFGKLKCENRIVSVQLFIFRHEIFYCQPITAGDLWFSTLYWAQIYFPLPLVVLKSSIHRCQYCKVIILYVTTGHQMSAHIGKRKVTSFVLLSFPIIVLFSWNFVTSFFYHERYYRWKRVVIWLLQVSFVLLEVIWDYVF